MEKKELSDAWTGFTRFVLLKGRPPEGHTWSGRRLTRKQTTSRPDGVWSDMWQFMSDAAKKKAKHRWAIEKPKLDSARQLRGIFFIEPNDEESQLTMEAARRKLEVPMPAAMPCKNTDKKQWRNSIAVLGNARRNTLVLLTPTKARDQGQKEQYTNITKIMSLKGHEFYESSQSCAQIHSDASSIQQFLMPRHQWRWHGS